MRKIIVGSLLMALVVVGFGIQESAEATVNAQNGDVSHYVSDRLGISFDYNSDWQVLESGVTISIGLKADGSVFDEFSYMEDGDAVITLTSFNDITAAFQIEEMPNLDDPVDFFQVLVDAITETQAALGEDWEERFGTPYEPTIIIENVRAFNVGERAMAKADLIQGDDIGIVVFIPLPYDNFATLTGVSSNAGFEAHEAALDIVAGSIAFEQIIINPSDYPLISILNVAELEVLAAMQHSSGTIRGADISSDGTQFAIASSGGVVIYDLATREIDQILSDEAFFYGVTFSLDGTQIIAGRQDVETDEFSVVVWNLESGEVEQRLTDFDKAVSSLQLAGNGDLLMAHAAGSYTGSVYFYETETWTLVNSIEERLEVATVSSDGRFLASMDFNTIRVWDIVETPTLLWELEYDPVTGIRGGSDLKFIPDDTGLLAVYGAKGDASDEFHFDVFDPETGTKLVEYVEHAGGYTVVNFSPDGQLVAAAKYYGDLAFVNPATGEYIRLVEGEHEDDITFIEFTPDGQLLITIDKNNAIQVWGVR